MIPSPWVGLLLALASLRAVRLLGWDDLPPIVWVRAKMTGEQAVTTGSMAARHGLTNETPEMVYRYRWPTLAHFLHCAYCSGAWMSAMFYAAWLEWPRPTMYAAVPAALSSIVGLVARNYDP